jgi:hypothetical protein
MRNKLIPLLLTAALCLVLACPAWAEDTNVTVWGLVVNTDFGLVIKDGDTEYLLIGVEEAPSSLAGKTCEVTGTKTNSLGIDTINVETIEIIGDTSSMNYTSMNPQPGGPENRLA